MPTDSEQSTSGTPPQGGPYLKAALFCERVLDEKDNVLSLVRVVDRFTVTASGPQAPKDMPAIPQRLLAVVMLISGLAKGPEEVRLEMERPDATTKDVWIGTVHMEGGQKGQNLILNFQETFELAGVYWFNLYVGEHLLTKMPVEVRYAWFTSSAH